MAIEKKQVELKNLLFDPSNPRLPELLGKDQAEIFRFLVSEIGVEDVIQSVAASGMIEGDPIIARVAPENTEKFFVVEGNRRLAALKLLNGEKIGDGKPEPTVPQIDAAVKASIGKITIQVGWVTADIDAYLGYKHVTATREWPPEAKARFVIDRVNGDFSSNNLAAFSKRLGTTPPTLRRWIVAYLTLKQAQRVGSFNPEDAPGKRYFGTFYTLLGSQQVQNFLGVRSEPVTANPVDDAHLDNLSEFIGWVIGIKKKPPVINSRKQKELDAVLSSPSALQHFRLRGNLDAALLYTEFNAKEISAKLLTAAYGIEECFPKLYEVRNDPAVINAIKAVDRAYDGLKRNSSETQATKQQQ